MTKRVLLRAGAATSAFLLQYMLSLTFGPEPSGKHAGHSK